MNWNAVWITDDIWNVTYECQTPTLPRTISNCCSVISVIYWFLFLLTNSSINYCQFVHYVPNFNKLSPKMEAHLNQNYPNILTVNVHTENSRKIYETITNKNKQKITITTTREEKNRNKSIRVATWVDKRITNKRNATQNRM